ncbi:MAG: SDR family NAD(P)-dependent oxidoreductase [Gammaproteobacteria bacterium]|nr:SDR family NAD(P)-dependent oxidoreductase [Gammaproteobacteria bacterium]
MSDWKGKVCVITGAASGIGAGLAQHAASLGMQVCAADVDTAGLRNLAKTLAGRDQVCDTMLVDVSDADAVAALAASVFSSYGKVNLLFNNAGVLVDGKSWERSEQDWRWNLDVNIMGVVNGIRSFVPRMLAQQEAGRVINTSSVGGLLGGGSFLGPYQASKHAIAAITETLFQELRLEAAPISASCLCPGEVATGIWESDRLRNESDRPQLGSEGEQQFHDAVAGMVADGLTPADFAARVWAGIEANKFWILPQPEFKPMYQLRVDSVMNESDPLGMADMLNPAQQSD